MARVFISYKRSEALEFATKLRKSLLEVGFEAYLDQEDVLPGEHWKTRLEGLIRLADAVVFVVSPGSVAGWELEPPNESVCGWEIRRTISLNKSLLPIIWQFEQPRRLPPEIANINWVSFSQYRKTRSDADFSRAFTECRRALSVANELWTRDHSKWVARAAEWDEAGRSQGKLLRAADISAVETWIRLKPSSFLTRADAASASMASVPKVLTDFLNASRARERKDRADLLDRERRIVKEQQKLIAHHMEKAIVERRFDRALKLGLAARQIDAKVGKKTPIAPELLSRMAQAASLSPLRSVIPLKKHEFHELRSLEYLQDGMSVLASWSNRFEIWNTLTGELTKCVEKVWSNASPPVLSQKGAIAYLEGVGHAAIVLRDNGEVRQFGVKARSDEGIVAFSESGDKLYCMSGGILQCWEVESDKELKQYKIKHNSFSRKFAFSFGAKFLISSGAYDCTIWDTQTGRPVRNIDFKYERVNRWVDLMRFSNDGSLFVVCHNDGAFQVFKTADGKEVLRSVGHRDLSIRHVWGRQNTIVSVSFSPTSDRLVTGSLDGTVRVWHILSGAEVVRLESNGRRPRVTFSPCGLLAAASAGEYIQIFESHLRRESSTLESHKERLNSVKYSSDGETIATSSHDKTVCVWNAKNRTIRKRLGPYESFVEALSFAKSGEKLAFITSDKTVRIWNLQSNLEEASIEHQDMRQMAGTDICFSPNGVLGAVVSFGDIIFYDGVKKRKKCTGGNCIAFSSDGKYCATGSFVVGQIKIYDGRTFGHLFDLAYESSRADREVTSLAFSPDSSRIAISSRNSCAALYDLNSRKMLQEFVGHRQEVWSIAFAPSGERIATASSDWSVRIWDTETGIEVARLDHPNRVDDVCFSPRGDVLVTAGDDGIAYIWEVMISGATITSTQLFEYADLRLGASGRLTESEEHDFIRIFGRASKAQDHSTHAVETGKPGMPRSRKSNSLVASSCGIVARIDDLRAQALLRSVKRR